MRYCCRGMWTGNAIDRLFIKWKFYLSDKIKWDFFQEMCSVSTAVWMHPLNSKETHGKKAIWKLSKNAMRCFEQSWSQHPTKQLLYCDLPPISQAIHVRRTAGHCWKNKEKTISNVFLSTPAHRCDNFSWPALLYIDELYADIRCRLEVVKKNDGP